MERDPDPTPCVRCDATLAWSVPTDLVVELFHRVPFHTLPGTRRPTLVTKWRRARLRTLICDECGHVRWDVPHHEDEVVEGRKVPPTCPRCARESCRHIAIVFHLVHRGFPQYVREGPLEAFVCADCGAVGWSVRRPHALAVFRGDELGAVENFRCPSCAADTGWSVEPLRRESSRFPKLHIHRKLGHFEIIICRGCGLADWFARDLSGLRPDPDRGVVRVKTLSPTSGGGPYR